MKRLIKKIFLAVNFIVIAATLLALLSEHISPDRMWHIAFFGLLFPVFVILNFLFLIFWIFRLKYYFVFSLAIIVISWGHTSRLIQFRGPKTNNNSEETIDVVSYNVHIFNQLRNNHYEYTFDTIIDKIHELRPDVLCLQEYRSVTKSEKYTKEKLHNRFNFLPHHFEHYTHSESNYNFGLIIYSRFPIINKGSIDFENQTNGGCFADLLIHTDTVRVYNLHLQSIHLKKNTYTVLELDGLISPNQKRMGEVKEISRRLRNAYKTRAKQVDEMADHIRKSPFPVIICGDFNDTPISYSYNKLSHKLEDSFIEAGKGIGTTYLGEFPSVRIDYIFHSKYFKTTSYKTVNFRISDHLPITSTLVKRKSVN